MTVISASACRQVVTSADTVAKLQIAVVGLRRRHLYGNTRHSVLSVTVQVAGRGSDGCGVGVRHSFAELRRVASEVPKNARPGDYRTRRETSLSPYRSTVLPYQVQVPRSSSGRALSNSIQFKF